MWKKIHWGYGRITKADTYLIIVIYSDMDPNNPLHAKLLAEMKDFENIKLDDEDDPELRELGKELAKQGNI